MIGELIGAAGSLIGSALSSDSAEDQQKAAMDFSERQFAEQRSLAREGIRFRVQDASLAGIHPLYALGGSPAGGSPVGMAGSPGDDSMGPGFAAAGQDIGRAVMAAMNDSERQNAYNDKIMKLQEDRLGLENDLLRSRIARFNNPTQLPPPYPLSNMVVDKPLERTVSANGFSEPGPVTDFGYVQTPFGRSIVPSKDAKERIEDQTMNELGWSLRNQVLPNFMPSKFAPPKKDLPKGHDSWKWSPMLQGYIPWKSSWDSSSALNKYVDDIQSGATLKRYRRK